MCVCVFPLSPPCMPLSGGPAAVRRTSGTDHHRRGLAAWNVANGRQGLGRGSRPAGMASGCLSPLVSVSLRLSPFVPVCLRLCDTSLLRSPSFSHTPTRYLSLSLSLSLLLLPSPSPFLSLSFCLFPSPSLFARTYLSDRFSLRSVSHSLSPTSSHAKHRMCVCVCVSRRWRLS